MTNTYFFVLGNLGFIVIQASERRCEELITQVPDSTRPLLRQIEAMQVHLHLIDLIMCGCIFAVYISMVHIFVRCFSYLTTSCFPNCDRRILLEGPKLGLL